MTLDGLNLLNLHSNLPFLKEIFVHDISGYLAEVDVPFKIHVSRNWSGPQLLSYISEIPLLNLVNPGFHLAQSFIEAVQFTGKDHEYSSLDTSDVIFGDNPND